MNDDNWELINGEAAHDIEFLNRLSQVNLVNAMIVFSLHHHGSEKYGCSHHLNQTALKELHRTGTFLLLRRPGEYRRSQVDVRNQRNEVVYIPPGAKEISSSLKHFFDILNRRWAAYKPIEAGAFTLWFINWVHPFMNGNGRTARAFCYATMGMRMGYVPPGSKTVPELITENDTEYEEYQLGLRAADATFGAESEPDLSRLERQLDRLLGEQLDNAVREEEQRP